MGSQATRGGAVERIPSADERCLFQDEVTEASIRARDLNQKQDGRMEGEEGSSSRRSPQVAVA